jgi:Skp family chaperone for outer membrane proteins
MRVLKSSILPAVVILALAAPAFAQTTPPPAPKPATPPATQPATPPAAQPAAPKTPPVPFPADAKIAFIDVNQVAGASAAGKDASKKLTALREKKLAEISEKNKQLTALTTKRDTGSAVLNETARAALDKDIGRLQRDIQTAQQDADAEMQDLTNELQGEFQKRLIPVIEEVAKEKGLHAVFSVADSGVAYVHPGLNISDEVIKRLDAAVNK